ncbi:MAG: molybdopterin-dependent oxidoreductase [Ilumatobacter sp.]|uniref:molybdopterin-dependent oxidoreductase n=1 Tax=Ilumatobacter sp. TaxID=1967498 RepID=UPI002612F5BB|nr:molybdopterin-dependent oxidoreductase [Ilumatobacter sp.]MDJ0770560.1 molybdopterin-dependent oxidoreductase [Ilumatobacter sp.]
MTERDGTDGDPSIQIGDDAVAGDAGESDAPGDASGHRSTRRELELRAQARSGEAIPVDEFKKRSRRSFLTGAAGVVGAGLFWRWVQNRPVDDGIPDVIRDQLERNEAIWSALPARSAPEFDIEDASPIRVNGRIGIRDEIDLAAWTVRVEGPDGELLDELDISTFEALPQRDLVIEHKCIEGWSHVTHWGGARFSDFHERYADRVGDVPYVGLETPDGGYYVGWDIDSILHPQTLLALREHGEPLDQAHGAPLRLASPNKYGIKTLKRIGVIRYTHERPADYWAERSYDWYAGL